MGQEASIRFIFHYTIMYSKICILLEKLDNVIEYVSKYLFEWSPVSPGLHHLTTMVKVAVAVLMEAENSSPPT